MAHRAAELGVELAAVAAGRLADGQLPEAALPVLDRVRYQALLRVDLRIQRLFLIEHWSACISQLRARALAPTAQLDPQGEYLSLTHTVCRTRNKMPRHDGFLRLVGQF